MRIALLLVCPTPTSYLQSILLLTNLPLSAIQLSAIYQLYSYQLFIGCAYPTSTHLLVFYSSYFQSMDFLSSTFLRLLSFHPVQLQSWLILTIPYSFFNQPLSFKAGFLGQQPTLHSLPTMREMKLWKPTVVFWSGNRSQLFLMQRGHSNHIPSQRLQAK